MSCKHCDDGRLTRNFYPQLGLDPDAEQKFYMYSVVKGIFDGPDGPLWAEVHVPINSMEHMLEGAKAANYTRARFCPVCGGEI